MGCNANCKQICNCGRAKCEPTVVFLVGWSAALYWEVFAKFVHFPGMPVLYQLICLESSRQGPGVEFKFHLMTDVPQAAQAQCVSLIINTCSFKLRHLKWP